MSNYRRAFVPGGCWFFTVNLLERRRSLLVDHVATLREAVAATRASHDFAIDAFVVLPDHLHAIWKLPAGDSDFSTRWRLIKTRFVKRCRSRNGAALFALRAASAGSGSGVSGSI
jgi:putative transposase